MISYRISEADLIARIDARKPGWRAKAKVATDACAAAGKYLKGIPKNNATAEKAKKFDRLWSEIKEVFMKLQYNKCCYCERKLPNARYGKGEHDVEHYRPKSRIQNWFTKSVKDALDGWPASFGQRGESTKGYHLLAFNPLNYATSCRECNSPIKADKFPCGKSPKLDAKTPAEADAEEPWLIFPVGESDDSAESLIRFTGITAEPLHDPGTDLRRYWRAVVTIEFFKLNAPDDTNGAGNAGEEREFLYRERAAAISELCSELDALKTAQSAQRRTKAEQKIARLTSPQSAHCNCKRSFLKLWINPATHEKANEIWDEVEDYLESVEPYLNG